MIISLLLEILKLKKDVSPMRKLLSLLGRYDKLLHTGLLIFPWLTVPFLNKRTFKRFMPGAIFICLIVTVECIVAHRRQWWHFEKKLIPGFLGEIPFIIGPFFVGTLWIMKFTFGNFFRYFIVNFIIDSTFVLVFTGFLEQMRIAWFQRLNKLQFLLLFLGKAILLYIFQIFWNKKRA